jgi:hypothetical protein
VVDGVLVLLVFVVFFVAMLASVTRVRPVAKKMTF